jgi:hypothetical protein
MSGIIADVNHEIGLRSLVGLFLFCVVAMSVLAQAPPGQDTFVSAAKSAANYGGNPSLAQYWNRCWIQHHSLRLFMFSPVEDNQRTARGAGPERIARTSRSAPRPEPKQMEKEEQSAAIKRLSRWGFVRGNPVLNSHFSPGPAPQVGQRMASIFLAVIFVAFMARSCGRTNDKDGQYCTVKADY